jgi:hypothetical protein
MGTWTNSDGLYIKFGVDEATQHKVGQYQADVAGLHVIEAEILWSDLAATGSTTILSDTLYIPSNAFIESATFRVETAFASAGSATLTFGLIRKDRSTAIDADGIDATIAVAALTAGATITCDGALIGTRLSTYPALLTALEGTAAFTAGKGVLRITYRI